MPISKLIAFYENFSPESIQRLGEVYDDAITFKDPLHEITGLKALIGYFQHVCNSSVSFEITAESEFDNGQKAFLRWDMRYAHPALNKGRVLTLEGVSFIECRKADNAVQPSKVLFQQDYYDLGAMVYQHVPVLGFAVRKVNQKLKAGA